MSRRQFYLKILDLSGTVKARFSPNYDGGLDSIDLTEVACINGEDVIGTFRADLHSVRDPAWKFQRDIQRLVKREYRAEFYASPLFKGKPEFTGVITQKPITVSEDGRSVVTLIGEDASHRLKARFLRRFENLDGNASTVALGLLSTYKTIVLWDNFATDLTKWATTTGWTIGSGVITATSGGGGFLATAEKAAGYCSDAKLSIDLKIPENGNYSIYFPYQAGSEQYYQVLIASDSSISGDLLQITVSYDNAGAFTTLETRDFSAPCDQYLHFDMYYKRSGNDHTITVDMNGAELIVATQTNAGANTSGAFYLVIGGTGDNYYADNFCWLSKAAALTAGTFGSTTTTLDQPASAMSHRDALNRIANLLGWEWRVNPEAGEGNDTVDFGSNIGYDWSGKFTFLETEDRFNPFRIISANANESAEGFATWLQTYGERQDDANSSFISTSLANIDTYGVVEAQNTDDRIIDVATAKTISDARLSQMAGELPSYSFTIIDETRLYEQMPIGGYAIGGDAIGGGREKLRAGDTIGVTSESLDLFKEQMQVLSLRRYKADARSIAQYGPGDRVDVVCERQPWRRRNLVKQTNQRLDAQRRAFDLTFDTQTLQFSLSGTTAQSFSFNLRGNYRSVILDISSPTWAGNITVGIDGSDRTSVLFGAANISANKSAEDTTYLSNAGAHYITITPTVTVNITVQVRPQVTR